MRIRDDSTGRDPHDRELVPLLARFDPGIRTLVRDARRRLRRRLPTAIELVYDSARRLAIGFAASERACDMIVSIVIDPRGVTLCFPNGAGLHDPCDLLMGRGNRRVIRLESAARLDEPDLAALVTAAIAASDVRLPGSGRGRLVIKSISPRQSRGAQRRI